MKLMTRRFLLFLVLLLIGLGPTPANAHHSFAATYYVDQEIVVKGAISEFLYRNPHSFVKITAKDDSGSPVIWALEWGGGAQLAQDHVNRDTLRPGDEVVVSGNPGRDPAEHRIRVHKIVRPSDGWKWEGVVM
jgi:hypothetical protein